MENQLSVEQLIYIYEKFGENAQDAVEFIKKNKAPEADVIKQSSEVSAKFKSGYEAILRDGVYIVYRDGGYEEFDGDNIKENVSFIGIAFDGHTFGVPLDHDYGKQRLLKEDNYPLDEHCLSEADALLNWDFVGETEYLKQLGLAFELKEGHYLTTTPVFLAEYAFKEELNKALKYLGAKEINFRAYRWFAQRYDVDGAWAFNGTNGYLSDDNVNHAHQVGAVTLWNP